MSYLKDREIWLSSVPTGNPPAGYVWVFIQNGVFVVRDSSGVDKIMATTTGTVTNATSASYVEYSNVANKPALISSSAQIVGYNVFATTGSNQFNGSQAVTGSLTVTGQVVAQTLNVQQVTSSIVYSSGSNVFGNSLSNTQQFTGSMSVTGSMTVNGAGTFASSITAGNNLLINNLAASKKGYTYQSPASNWGPQVSGLYFTPNNAVDAQTTFTLELWNGVGSIITPLTIADTGTSTFTGTSASPVLTLSNSTGGTKADFTITENTGLIVNSYESTSARSIDFRVAGTSALLIASSGAATFSSSVTATSLITGTAGGSSINITTNGNNGTSGSPLQTNLNFYGFNSNLNGQIRVDDIAGTAQIGTMKFYTWNSGQVLALTLTQTGAAAFSSTIDLSGAITNFGTGTGTYTRSVWYNDPTNQILFENARQTDDASGTGRTVYFTWRGGPSVGGGVQLQHGTNAWAAYTSDARLKTKVADVENGIEVVMRLNPIKFKWSRELENSRTVTGFTAQNVEEAIPDAVFNSWQDEELGDVKSYYSDYLIPYLVKAIQELKSENDNLKSRLEVLEQS
jgi:hypothetical protein